MRLCEFDVTHLSTVDNGKASKKQCVYQPPRASVRFERYGLSNRG